MNKILLTLVLAGALGLSSLAMAGSLGSADSEFLFRNDKVEATKVEAKTVSDKEMRETQGQALIGGNLIHVNNVRLCNNRCLDLDLL